MRYGSVCSGVEAASLAWAHQENGCEPLGWECAFVSEIEKFPSAVLQHHYPNVPNLGDMTSADFADRCADQGAIDLLVGGTPCQSFSVAGLRGGLDDERGNLALEFCRLADRLAPRWIVWENVPGVLSSSGGRDFGSIVGAMVELGYNVAWRILDAQHFGVPQRRRRIFLVGHLGAEQRGAAAVLFEQHCLQGHPAPSREAREDATADAGSSPTHSLTKRYESSEDGTGRGVPLVPHVANTLGNRGLRSHTELDGHGDIRPMPVGHRMAAFGEYVDDGTSSTIKERDYKDATDLICVNARETPVSASGKSLPLGAQDRGHAVATSMQVRRLTPRECERLQGMPDDWTKIPWRKKDAEDCPDGPRYKAIGNSMAVPVMRWIGERIQMVEEVLR